MGENLLGSKITVLSVRHKLNFHNLLLHLHDESKHSIVSVFVGNFSMQLVRTTNIVQTMVLTNSTDSSNTLHYLQPLVQSPYRGP